jgi:hypothetical protein
MTNGAWQLRDHQADSTNSSWANDLNQYNTFKLFDALGCPAVVRQDDQPAKCNRLFMPSIQGIYYIGYQPPAEAPSIIQRLSAGGDIEKSIAPAILIQYSCDCGLDHRDNSRE